MVGVGERLFGGILHEHDLVPSVLSSAPNWFREAIEEFQTIIKNLKFPCVYASKSNLYYSYANSILVNRDAVASHFEQYVEALKSLEREDAGLAARTLLVTFEKPRENYVSVDEYQCETWELLRFLLYADREPWPDTIPRDPDTSKWEFCFAGVPLFVNVCTPSHLKRRSRNLGRSLTLVVQGRAGIDFCAPPTDEGNPARELIRTRLDSFDQVPRCSDLNVYGIESNRQWKLYFLSDDGKPRTGECPLSATQNQNPSNRR